MTETRIDQGGLYVLTAITPEIRADQAGLYALVKTGVTTRIDQAGLMALVAVTAEVRTDQAGMYVLAGAPPCVSQESQIWTITRTDGETFRFTSRDEDLEWPVGSGIIYQSCDSLVPSASEAVSELDAESNMDLSGAIGPEGISADALYAGLFDGARVEAWLVPWTATYPPRRLLRGTFGSVEQTKTGFKCEVLGDGAKLKQTTLIFLIQPGCRWRFGDPKTCQKDLGPLTVTGTVDTATGQRSFVDAARIETAGYFRRGQVTFTSGANAGVSAEIKEHTAGGNFELWPRLPFPIGADDYSMTPGCTQLSESSNGTNGCADWGQKLRYGGEEKVPGKDKRGKAADVRTS